ncbi:hypothetical protein SAMN06265173_101223 [Thalassovita litoralis]|jgi:hypothetical protein|uniref:Uncharacterized protein n=1 Tax=Thalassovita litoralis TaxID=1010611 RepID=A0A521AKV9_9RHOB|nr:hypothetical protein [Thalassovita litoralis]SMO35438.1 hypothetical protein SAMN06265173_101223 [Thalassovita litoralis]
MQKIETITPAISNSVLELVRQERMKSVSVREWKFRLMGYGYRVMDTDHGEVIANLRKQEICAVPADLLH